MDRLFKITNVYRTQTVANICNTSFPSRTEQGRMNPSIFINNIIPVDISML